MATSSKRKLLPLTEEEIKLGLRYDKNGVLYKKRWYHSSDVQGVFYLVQLWLILIVLTFFDRTHHRVIETDKGITIIPKSDVQYFYGLNEIFTFLVIAITIFIVILMLIAWLMPPQDFDDKKIIILGSMVLIGLILLSLIIAFNTYAEFYKILFDFVHN